MQLVINGQEQDLQDVATVADLLARLNLHPRRVAVERNKLLVPRAQFDDARLAEGDRLEIVTLVGGG